MGYTLTESLRDNSKVSGISTSKDTLMAKWKPELDLIRESLGKKFSEERALTTAILMENTSRRVDASVQTRRLFESIQPLTLAA